LKKQMPLLTQRLNNTLEKLRSPENISSPTAETNGSLFRWWDQLQLRYSGRHIEFSSDINRDIEIPVEVFNTVIENLLENARSKRIREPQLQIFVELSNKENRVRLSVMDTGSAIDPQVHEKLFKEVVSSHDGFGIGLYQSFELARSNGYVLHVENNVDGNVCFTLT
jgi:signal transduction histidine kinase